MNTTKRSRPTQRRPLAPRPAEPPPAAVLVPETVAEQRQAPAPEGGDGVRAEPFWRRKTLDEMTRAEWESLCDGCGRCCLIKLEDEDTGRIYYTDVGCTLLDATACQCRDYPLRQRQVPDCLKLTPDTVQRLTWLPPTCAYRLVREGRDLYWWHHLVSDDRETVHLARVSVRGRVCASEDEVPVEDLIDRIVRWPERVPKGAARNAKRAEERAAEGANAREHARRTPIPARERR